MHVRTIKTKNKAGAVLQFNVKKLDVFRVPSGTSRAFYPAAQEWGAAAATPPIPKDGELKAPFTRATEKKGQAALTEFNNQFPKYYDLAIQQERVLTDLG
jgi:hypothetical protein